MDRQPNGPSDVKNGADNQAAATSKSGLSRSIGKWTAAFLTAAMIIGTGLFSSLGATAAKAGSGLLLAMMLGGLVALATGLSAAQLGINFPEEGGAFTWSRKFGRETLGFIAGCSYLGKGIVSTVVIALAFANYSARIAPGLPLHVVAAGAVLLAMAVNILGIDLNAKALIYLLFVELALLGILVGFSAHAARPSNLTPVLGN